LGGVDRASRLVEQLLLLARHEPHSPPERKVISLTACIEQAANDVQAFQLSRHVTLQYGVLEQVHIPGDAESLRIMVRNLLDNAIRYIPENGVVQIDLATAGNIAGLTIQDSGAGIPEEDRERVFDRFYRVPGTSPSGSGLGMAIVKAIAEQHDAVIVLDKAVLGGLSIHISFVLDAGDTSSALPEQAAS